MPEARAASAAAMTFGAEFSYKSAACEPLIVVGGVSLKFSLSWPKTSAAFAAFLAFSSAAALVASLASPSKADLIPTRFTHSILFSDFRFST